jgi:hypothetical protein
MNWPNATDYNAAVQNPQLCFRDDDLRRGQTVGDLFGLPRPHSGNFADVYQIQGGDGQSWAVKCFTRPVAGLRPRYQAICEHLQQTQRAFMVEFHFLDEGIHVRDQWLPLVKMRWVEGLRLNEFVREQLSKPLVLERLAQMWVRLAQELRDAQMAHGDLQHGNVLLVPSTRSSLLSLKLIDYDGMFVPALSDRPSAEVGHPNYQHPRRLRDGGYDGAMDRFAHLLIYTALRCLRIGGEDLWQRHDNQENLLFREEDFRQPSKSRLLGDLWDITDRDCRNLVGHLLLASLGPLSVVPTLDELLASSGVRPLSDREEARVNDLLDDGILSGGRQPPERRQAQGANAPRSGARTALIAAAPTAETAALTDTRPIALEARTAEAPVPERRSSIEIERDAQPPPLASVAKNPLDVGTLTDPLVSILSRPAWLAVLGLIALVSFLVVNVLVWSSVKQPQTAAANRRPTLADIDEVALKAGHKQAIHFAVKRHDCREPLTLRLEGLPDEMKMSPLILEANEDKASLTLQPPLGLASSKRAARVSLWQGDDKLDEKSFHLTIQKTPRPLLRALSEIACSSGHSALFVFGVQRDDCREPLVLRLEGLPPGVQQESLANADADTLSVKLTVAAGLAPQPISAKLLLCAGEAIMDSKSLRIDIREDADSTRQKEEQKPRLRLKALMSHSLAVEPGKSGRLSIALERSNYRGEVEVRLEGLPAGVTAAPVTVPPGLSAANVTLETAAETQPGKHDAKLRLLIDKRIVEERDIALTVERGRQEIVHFQAVDHMELTGTLYHGWRGKKGMTVLMLHDLGSNRSSPGWKRLADKLQTEGHTVLTFDFRGYGDSKKVSTKFWTYSVNKALTLPVHEPGLPPERQPKTLEGADLPTEYIPWLVEDIAAARTYLDLRHDEENGPVNTFNMVVLGAGQSSALGSLWLATEGLRYNAADVGNKIRLKWPEKLSVLQVMWIGMADPLKFRRLGILGWLEGAHAEPVVPITFVYGGDDADTASLLTIPLREKLGSKFILPGVQLSGQRMLDADGEAAARIQKHLLKTLQSRPPVDWVPRKIKTLHSYWAIPEELPRGSKQLRFFVAKRVGEETLSPVPFQPLRVPPIRGLAEPSSFLRGTLER